jgi:thiamine-monophosphate kinase
MTSLAREDEVLERIRGMVGNGIEAFGLRDDAAVLEVWGGGPLVLSVDSVVEGVHVDLSVCSPADVGWKALMGALSDLAAMGAAPVGALVALCVPGGTGDGELATGVMSGAAEAAAAAGCPVLGGDVSGARQLVVAVTVLGKVPEGEPGPVSRAGARGGDAVLVTGPCGASAAGLRLLRTGRVGPVTAGNDETGVGRAYRRPVARLREGEAARRAGAHAMIDVSDGLGLDLHRLADASGVGFELGPVPVADGATLEEALGGGEDYELIVAVDGGRVGELSSAFEANGLRPPLHLGVLTADPAGRRVRGERLAPVGWQHRLG